MRQYTLKENITSALLGAAIALLLAIPLRPLYEREQEERRRLEAEWVREQIAADRAYEAEVQAEKERWAAMEEEQQLEAITLKQMQEEEAEPFNDPDIPDEVEEAARKWGEVYEFSPEYLEAIAWTESRYDPEAVNGGCYGLMQVSTYWHTDRMERLGATDIWDIDDNMMTAADYLRELWGQHQDPYWVLMTYNGDLDADAYLRGEAPPSEYALTITELTLELKMKHEGGEAIEH